MNEMCTLSLFVLLALSAGCLATEMHDTEGVYKDVLSTRVFENTINETLEDLKQTLINGDPENGIPSFAPLVIDHVPLLLDIEKIIETNGTISNLIISGIPDFIATYLKFTLIGTTFDFTILVPQLKANCKYEGFAKLFQFIPLYGDGIIGATIENLEINGSVKINLLQRIRVTDMEIVLSIDAAKFELTGFMDDEILTQLICDALNEIVEPLLNEYKTELSEIISPLLMNLINKLLEAKLNIE